MKLFVMMLFIFNTCAYSETSFDDPENIKSKVEEIQEIKERLKKRKMRIKARHEKQRKRTRKDNK